MAQGDYIQPRRQNLPNLEGLEESRTQGFSLGEKETKTDTNQWTQKWKIHGQELGMGWNPPKYGINTKHVWPTTMAPKTVAVIYNLTARKRAFDSPVGMQAPGDRRRRPGGAQGSGTSSEFSRGFLCSGGPEQSRKFSSKNGDDTSTSWGAVLLRVTWLMHLRHLDQCLVTVTSQYVFAVSNGLVSHSRDFN